MSVLYGIILGIIQGIAEFLPISSFGHLYIAENMLGIERQAGLLLEVMLHLGTLAALIFTFRRDIKKMALELAGMCMDTVGNLHLWFHNRRTGDELRYAKIVSSVYRKFTALVLVSAIPTAILGYTARHLAERAAVSPLIPGACILLTGVVLLVVDFSNAGGKKTPGEAKYGDAMWVGICQGISVFPGISRSGITISAGLLCGFSRKFAVKYSFIMSIPAIIGAFFVEMGEFASPDMSGSLGLTYVLGMLTAGIVGYFTIRFLLKLVQTVRFRWFAIYCFAAGAVALVWNYL